MMLDRMEGNAELKTSVQQMLATRRLTHSVLLVGEAGLGTGFAARCIAADYLYPAGGAAAEALLRGECCRAVAKAGKRDSGTVETGIVREAISVSGMGSGGKYLVGQVTAMRSEIFNTSLSAEGRAVLLYHVERMNEESANALLKVMEEPPEGVLFLLTADSLASVLPTIRSRCVSFAVAPVSPEQCARYCAAQGVDKKTAALYSELFDGHIGTVLAAAQDEARTAQVEKALQLAKAAADRDSYAAACLLAAYEKDKAGAAALLTDFRAVAAAGLRQSPHAPVQGIAAQRALRLADAGEKVTIVDFDIVNPYFRTADFAKLFEERGVTLAASMYANTSLDIPAISFDMERMAYEDGYLIIDVGGDDAGAIGLGRYAEGFSAYVPDQLDMWYVVNRYRYLTEEPQETLELMYEIEAVSRMRHTGIVNNSNLGKETTAETILRAVPYAEEIAAQAKLPLVCTTCRKDLTVSVPDILPVEVFVKPVWEE